MTRTAKPSPVSPIDWFELECLKGHGFEYKPLQLPLVQVGDIGRADEGPDLPFPQTMKYECPSEEKPRRLRKVAANEYRSHGYECCCECCQDCEPALKSSTEWLLIGALTLAIWGAVEVVRGVL